MPRAGNALNRAEWRDAHLHGSPRSQGLEQAERMDHGAAECLPLRRQADVGRRDSAVQTGSPERGDCDRPGPRACAEGGSLRGYGVEQSLRVEASCWHRLRR